MAIIETANASSLKLKIDQGMDLNGERIVKTKTFSSVKSNANNQNLVDFATSITGLQEHSLTGITRIDSTSLSE